MMPKATTVTTKGQVTIPIEIREALGIEPHDKVEFVLDGNGARLRKRLSISEIAGSIPPLPSVMTVEDAIHEAKEERARRKFGPD
jgi:AbrB family looped-hinge helix DNA binding protein